MSDRIEIIGVFGEEVDAAVDTPLVVIEGPKGDPGAPGKDGHSPVVTATKSGKTTTISVDGADIATVEDGVDGKPGAAGSDGITPHIGDNGNWYLGDTDTGKPSRGAAGTPGTPGTPGKDGADGNTPVKGTDYWTASDKAEVVAEAAAAIDLTPYAKKTEVPTKTSQITNDSGFLTSHQSLAAYRTAAAQDEIDSGKVDKVTGKGLSTNDYTAAAKAKVDAIPANPKYTDTVYDDTALKERVSTIEGKESVWDAKSDFSGSYNDLTDKPTIPTEVTPLIGTTGTLTPTHVYEAVSAGIPVKVQCKDSTYGLLSFTAFNIAESLSIIVAQAIVYYNSVYILAELGGNIQAGNWFKKFTVLAEKTDIPSALPNPNALTIKIGSTTVTYDGSAAKTVEIADGSEVSY